MSIGHDIFQEVIDLSVGYKIAVVNEREKK